VRTAGPANQRAGRDDRSRVGTVRTGRPVGCASRPPGQWGRPGDRGTPRAEPSGPARNRARVSRSRTKPRSACRSGPAQRPRQGAKARVGPRRRIRSALNSRWKRTRGAPPGPLGDGVVGGVGEPAPGAGSRAKDVVALDPQASAARGPRRSLARWCRRHGQAATLKGASVGSAKSHCAGAPLAAVSGEIRLRAVSPSGLMRPAPKACPSPRAGHAFCVHGQAARSLRNDNWSGQACPRAGVTALSYVHMS
jgi:hypothetical protein